jgi:integrase
MMIYRPKDGGYWMAKWKFRGQVIRRSTRDTNKNAARKTESRLRSEFNRQQEEIDCAATRLGVAPEALSHCPECSRLFRSDRVMVAVDGARLCQDACRDIWNKRCRPVPMLKDFLNCDFLPVLTIAKSKTRAYYQYGTVRLLSFFGELRIDEVTSQHAKQFVAAHTRKLSPSTINCALRTLRRALNLAEEWGTLPRAPKIPLAAGERHRDRVVTEADFAAYLELCEQPWRDIAVLIRYECLRPGEVYDLRWENLSLDLNGLTLIVSGKSKAARRQLPMTPQVHAALLNRHLQQGKPETGWVFPATSRSGHVEQGSAKNQHAKAVRILASASAAYVLWKKHGAKGDWIEQAARKTGAAKSFIRRHAFVVTSGFAEFEPYCLRHTALTRLAEAGCDAFTLAKIAGHSSITITQRYCHPQAEAIERAFAKLPLLS